MPKGRTAGPRDSSDARLGRGAAILGAFECPPAIRSRQSLQTLVWTVTHEKPSPPTPFLKHGHSYVATIAAPLPFPLA